MQIRTSTRAPKATAEEGDDSSSGSHAAPRRKWSRKRRVLGLVGLAGGMLLLALVLLALPLVRAHSEAKRAQTELSAAKSALSANNYASANAYIKSARDDVRSAEGHANGPGSDVWASLPVFGGAVHDARHLIDALSQAVDVAQIGVEVYPMVTGGQLVQSEHVNLPVLQQVVSQATDIGPHLTAAMKDLRQVSGSTPLLGGSVSRARDSALSELTPVQASYHQTLPLIKSLPTILGANGPHGYLLALLNPSELRYSGGAALTIEPVTFKGGYIIFGGTLNVDAILEKGQFLNWPKVLGNTFHRAGPQRLTSSTFSPDWSVSGEELLRAFYAAYHQRYGGVIAVDLQALANLFSVTGPVDLGIKGVPPLSSDNLVKVLAGSYDAYQTAKRHRINAALVPAFSQRLFDSGDMTKKAQTLLDSAKGRHFAAYFRDPRIQRNFAKVGLSGNLSSTSNDYLGVFTQNTNGSKMDYYQRRAVTSHVRLHDNGSATVHLEVKVGNTAPPYHGTVPDPQSGYSTRFLGAALGVFLPNHSRILSSSANGAPYVPHLRHPYVRFVHNRPYFARQMMINSGQSSTLKVTYQVPHAAVLNRDGTMSYKVDVDPQDTVVPEKLNLEVTWPPGYAPQSLPPGWNATSGQTATYSAPVTEQLSFSVPLAH